MAVEERGRDIREVCVRCLIAVAHADSRGGRCDSRSLSNRADGNTPAGEPGRSTTAASQELRFATGPLREAIDAADT
jgi:hypothetical protein